MIAPLKSSVQEGFSKLLAGGSHAFSFLVKWVGRDDLEVAIKHISAISGSLAFNRV
jgi:hypothetical protein